MNSFDSLTYLYTGTTLFGKMLNRIMARTVEVIYDVGAISYKVISICDHEVHCQTGCMVATSLTKLSLYSDVYCACTQNSAALNAGVKAKFTIGLVQSNTIRVHNSLDC